MTIDMFSVASSRLDEDWLYFPNDIAGNCSRKMFFSGVSHFQQQLEAFKLFDFAIVLCRRPENFITAFAAVAISGGAVLLPTTNKERVINELVERYQSVIVIYDDVLDKPADLPGVYLDVASISTLQCIEPAEIPSIPSAQMVAILFSSGSTGQPTESRKNWGDLVTVSQLLQGRLQLGQQDCLLVTVPPQHAYGFETMVLMPFSAGIKLYSQNLFYPADISSAIKAMHSERLRPCLVTTPLHLKAMLDSGLKFRGLHQVISSGAPLSKQLARQAEETWSVPVFEIFGSTEMTSIATRRTTNESNWRLYPGISLEPVAGIWQAIASHLPHKPILDDKIELIPDRPASFRFLGRASDRINVAGKRISLQYLNNLLQEVPGVSDGVFVATDTGTVKERLQALVVAPGIDKSVIRKSLSEWLDPIFMPRRIYILDALPRNKVGKLSRDDILKLLGELRGGDAT